MFGPSADFGPRSFSLSMSENTDVFNPPGATTDLARYIRWSPELEIWIANAGAFSTSNYMYSSTDGIAWTDRTANLPRTDRLMASLEWFPELGLFVGPYAQVSGANGVGYSSDGINWSGADNPFAASWDGQAYSPSLGLIAAVAFGGADSSKHVMTSPDGINWTSRTCPNTQGISWNSIAWSESLGLFAAFAFGGGTTQRCMTSPDGINWTYRTLPIASMPWEDVCWSPEKGLFCAVAASDSGGASVIITSPDGINWTQRTTGVATSQLFRAVKWIAELGLFIAISGAVSAGVNKIHTSPDGITWTQIDSPSDKIWKSLDYSSKQRKALAVQIADPASILVMSVTNVG